MNRWFRFYQGTCEDGKFRMVARNANVTVATVIGVWACLLEDAAHPDHRGVAVRGEDFYAAILDLSPTDVQHILQFLEEVDCISVGHGAITITNWKERQYETDVADPTAADRQRRWREKHKPNTKQTPRNGAVTVASHPETEADTESETDKKDIRAVAKATRPSNDQFDQFWKSYPKRKGSNPKGPAEKLFDAAVKSGDPPEVIIAAVKLGVGFDRDKIGTEYIPQAVKWLRDKRWRDDADTPAAPVDLPGFYAPFGSDQLAAWDKTKPGGYPRDKAGGWRFPAEWPPGHGRSAA